MTKQEIYNFMAGRDVSTSFSDPAHTSEISFEEFIEIHNEVKRVNSEINNIVSGSKVLKEAVKATYDNETGEELTPYIPAVYYIPDSKTDFKKQFECEMLDKLELLKVFVAQKGFDYDTEWDKFLDSYK